jgi:hypothetical protein
MHVMVVVMMMVVEHAAGTGTRRCSNGQREKSCENVGE